MKKLLFFLLIVFLQTVFCQVKYQLAIGGTGTEYAYSIKPTTDGGLVAAGGTTTFGGGDFYIVKLDGNGSLQWTRYIGGPGNEEAFFIVQTSDGGYAVAGSTVSFGAGGSDFYIVKLNAAGNLEWNKSIGGAFEDVAFAIIQTSDGGYAITGYTDSFGAGNRDYYIVKLDAAGNLQWNRTAGGVNYEFGETLIQTSDGGYAAAGFTYSFGAGAGDFYIVKLDAGGTLQWSKTVGGNQPDYCLSIIQTSDGGFAAAGPTSSYGAGDNDFYVIKLDGSGNNLQWSRTIGGTGLDYAESVIQTSDRNYVIAGLTYSFGAGNKDMYVVKLDSIGNFLWNRTAGGPNYDYAESIIQTPDGGFAGAGHTDSFGAGDYDDYIVKIDAQGNTCGNSSSPAPFISSGGTLGNPNSVITTPVPIVTTPTAATGSGGTLTTICLVGIQPVSTELPDKYSLSQNYPNPFNPTTKIKFEIPSIVKHEKSNVKLIVYDVEGRLIDILVNENLSPGIYEATWTAANFASGVYFYKIVSGDPTGQGFTETKKMLMIK